MHGCMGSLKDYMRKFVHTSNISLLLISLYRFEIVQHYIFYINWRIIMYRMGRGPQVRHLVNLFMSFVNGDCLGQINRLG